jgi:hypothetical protein
MSEALGRSRFAHRSGEVFECPADIFVDGKLRVSPEIRPMTHRISGSFTFLYNGEKRLKQQAPRFGSWAESELHHEEWPPAKTQG